MDDHDFVDRYNKDVYFTNITTRDSVANTLVDILLNKYASFMNLNFDLTNMSNLLVFVKSSELGDTVPDNIFKTSYKPSSRNTNISVHLNMITNCYFQILIRFYITQIILL